MTGIDCIAEERDRQVIRYGHTGEVDQEHGDGSLLDAALAVLRDCVDEHRAEAGPMDDPEWVRKLRIHVANKYEDQFIHRMCIAGALIAAEIDRVHAAME